MSRGKVRFMNLDALMTAAKRPLTSAELDALNSSLNEFDRFIGLRFTHISSESVRAMVTVSERILQPAGLVNGGALSAIAETTGSVAGVVAAGAPVVGVNNSTDFLRGVRTGDITVDVTAVHTGRSSQLWRVEMHNDGSLAAVSHLRTFVLPARES